MFVFDFCLRFGFRFRNRFIVFEIVGISISVAFFRSSCFFELRFSFSPLSSFSFS